MSSALTSFGRSCCVQCPVPGRMTISYVRDVRLHCVHAREADDGVLLAADEQRRLADLRIRQLWKVLPVAVHVAIAVKARRGSRSA